VEKQNTLGPRAAMSAVLALSLPAMLAAASFEGQNSPAVIASGLLAATAIAVQNTAACTSRAACLRSRS
jgi:hypothetical protein